MSKVTKVRVGVEWVNTYNSPCNQNNLSYRDDHAVGFYNSMGGYGHYKIFNWGNSNAWETDFRHPDHGGDSLNWIDNVHFVFYSGHGGNWSNIFHNSFAVQKQHCLGSSNQWKLGVKKLKWIVFDSCQCVLSANSSHIGDVWFKSAHGVHMIFGFVGNGHDSWWTSDMGKDFGNSARSGKKLGNAWLDAAYSFWLDDNPIVIAFGATANEAKNRRDNETVNWRDYDVSSSNWLYWKWRH